MNSDGIVFGGERMGHSFYLLLGLLFCFVELRIEKKMNLLVLDPFFTKPGFGKTG
jgi:hypothetical protein